MTSRTMTEGEIKLAKRIFKDSINYNIVKIHNEKYIFFQPNNSGMTPNGEIYMNGSYSKDYSKLNGRAKSFLIHELVHVWQYQLNILNPITAAISQNFTNAFDYSKAYQYTLNPDKDILDYEIEQQAAIIEDYYLIYEAGLSPVAGHLQNTLSEAKSNQLFHKVLSKFLLSPAFARHTIECKKKSYGHPSQRRRVCRRMLQP